MHSWPWFLQDRQPSSSFVCRFDCSSNAVRIYPFSGYSRFTTDFFCFAYAFSAPVDGYYDRLVGPIASGYLISSTDGRTYSFLNSVYSRTYSEFTWHFTAGFSSVEEDFVGGRAYPTFLFCQGISPIYEIIPDNTIPTTTYSTTARPTSISGGNYERPDHPGRRQLHHHQQDQQHLL